jgi:apolipoprotein N-acyltransferase
MMKDINWTGTFCFIIAGLCFALHIDPYEKYAFAFFLIGHFLSLLNAKNKQIHSLIVRYYFFIIIDCIGIYRWWA